MPKGTILLEPKGSQFNAKRHLYLGLDIPRHYEQ